MLYQFVYHIFAPFMVLPFFRLFNRLEVSGVEHIPPSGPAVVIANHISSWDPALLYGLIRRKSYFMAKQELFDRPILGFILKRICAFPVKRETVDRTALRKAAQVLEEGHLLVIFPEGHRSETGEMQAFKQGAALFAHRSKAAVIPVLLENTRNAFPKSIGQKVKVVFGQSLDLTAFYGAKADSALLGEMTDTFKQGILRLASVREASLPVDANRM
ncbi:MAG: 1-acyl-sn-glycerol-3-phosphate acyltransferase [Clostridiales bacterium]|nr:1-acyl-sn-glycerol-3-phosphate acyltransferase [Clostridiales bacterium]